MELLAVIFFASIFGVFYAYVGYPVSLVLIGFFRNTTTQKSSFYPQVTLIITAHNEEKRIEEKLKNTMNLEYPRERLQVLVASDGSIDRTDEIVKNYKKYGIELLQISERGGKENAQKKAIASARGEVLVFSDVATRLDPDGLSEIVFNFADLGVGCVSSEDRLLTADGQPSGEGFYVKFEMWLRNLESKVNTLVGLSGSFFAARAEVCYDFSGQMQSDFRTLLNSVKIGLRGVSDSQAIGYYFDVGKQSREFSRKVRTVVRGLNVFFQHLEFLNPYKYGFFSYQIFCHKLLRWLVPFFLIIAFIFNSILAFNSTLYFVVLLMQILFYAAALLGLRYKNLENILIIKIPLYFTNVNASIAVAWFKFIKGERFIMWRPSER